MPAGTVAFLPSPARSAWALGPLVLRAPALALVAGVIIAIVIADRIYRHAGGPRGVITDVAAWAVPAGLLPVALGALTAGTRAQPWETVHQAETIAGLPGAVALGLLAAWAACRRPTLRPAPQPDPTSHSGSASPASSTSSPGPNPHPGPTRSSGSTRSPGPIDPSGSIDPSGPTHSIGPARFSRPTRPIGPFGLTRPIGPIGRFGPARYSGRVLAPPGRPIRLGPVLAAAAPAIALGNAVAQAGDWAAQQGFGRPSALPWAVLISPAHRPSGYENFATFAPVFLYLAIWDVLAGIAVAVLARRLALPGDRVFAVGAAAYSAGGFALFWLGIGHLPIILGLRAGELGDAAVLVGAIVYLVRTRRTRPKPTQNASQAALETDTPVM